MRVQEHQAKWIVYGVLGIALTIYTAYAIKRLAESYASPAQRFSTVKYKSLPSAGALVCPGNAYLGQIIVPGTVSCEVARKLDTGGQELVPCKLWRMENHTWAALVNDVSLCVVVYPGNELRHPRDTVHLQMHIYAPEFPNNSTAELIRALSYNNLWFGVFNDEASKATAPVNLGLAGGSNLIGVRYKTFTSLNGDTTTEHVVGNTLSTPLLTKETSYQVVNFYFFYPSMSIEKVVETLEFEPGDLLSAVGGILSILTFIAAKLNGEGKYDPNGFIHLVWYPPKTD